LSLTFRRKWSNGGNAKLSCRSSGKLSMTVQAELPPFDHTNAKARWPDQRPSCEGAKPIMISITDRRPWAAI
jgi:hypothetical protein